MKTIIGYLVILVGFITQIYAQDICDTACALKWSKVYYQAIEQNQSEQLSPANQKMIECTKGCKKNVWEAQYLVAKGNHFFTINQFDSSFYYYEKARHLFEQYPTKDYPILCGLYNHLGQFYCQHGDFVQGIQAFQKMYAFAQEWNNRKQQANALQNLGIGYSQVANYKVALKYYYRALNIIEKEKDTLVLAHIHLNLGGTLQLIKQYDEALAHGKQAIQFYTLKVKKESFQLASAYNLLATIYVKNNETQNALDNFLIAYQIFDKSGNVYYQAQVLANIALVYFQIKDSEKAIEYHQKAIVLAQQNGLKHIVAQNILSLAKNAPIPSERKMQYLAQAEQIALEANDIELLQEIHKAWEVLYSEKKNYRLAYLSLEKANLYFDQMYNEDLFSEMGEVRNHLCA